MTMNDYVLKVREWSTPATDYAEQTLGSASIQRGKQPKGYYRMEGVGGHMFYQCLKSIPLTMLKINNVTTMVDDPLHWLGMKLLAKHSKGNVLVGGLGLGLVAIALAKNPDVKEVTICDINKDVIDLVTPYVTQAWSDANADRLRILHENVFHHPIRAGDTIILDLWVKTHGDKPHPIADSMAQAIRLVRSQMHPFAKLFVWGVGDHKLNPSVDPKVRAKIPRNYADMITSSKRWGDN